MGRPSKYSPEFRERVELTKLRRENAKLRVEREILKDAAAFFVTESTR